MISLLPDNGIRTYVYRHITPHTLLLQSEKETSFMMGRMREKADPNFPTNLVFCIYPHCCFLFLFPPKAFYALPLTNMVMTHVIELCTKNLSHKDRHFNVVRKFGYFIVKKKILRKGDPMRLKASFISGQCS